jgi:phage shock protein PspC (stress-responsive transcriptional regulator)
MIAGVCAGLADYFAIDVSLVRLAWVILSIVPGGVIGGVVVYMLAWLIMPEPGAAREAAASLRPDRLTRSASNRKLGGVCGGLGEYFALDPTAVRVAWLVLTILPGAIVGGLIAYVLAWIVIPPPGAGSGFVSSPIQSPPSAI